MYLSKDSVYQIIDAANYETERILNQLGVDLENSVPYSDEIRMSCPIHHGDNNTAFSYHKKYKKWRCYTAHCHEDYPDNIIGLVMAISKCSFADAVEWTRSFLNIDSKSLKRIDYDISSQIREMKRLVKPTIVSRSTRINIDKKLFANRQTSKFFLDKGISETILEKFLVTDCNDRTKPMYNRACVPVVNQQNDRVIGVTGRIMMDKCPLCKCFHGKKCPTKYEKVVTYPKWKHFGFSSSEVLYNINSIENNRNVFICEGPKDVWKLDEAGIHNSVAIFGLNLSKYQIELLINLNAQKLIFVLDNDERGIEQTKKNIANVEHIFKAFSLHDIIDKDKDIADMSVDFVKQNIGKYA